MKKHLSVLKTIAAISLIVTLAACKKKEAQPAAAITPTTSKIDSTSITSGTPVGSTQTGLNTNDFVENSTFTNTITITYGTTVTINNPLLNKGVSIVQTGAGLVINSTVSGVAYAVSGTTSNGYLKIYSTNKFELMLNGANITNPNGPAINIQTTKPAFIVLAANSTNTLADGSTYATAPNNENQKGTIFSEGQMIFSGSGSLSVQGNYKHAICSDQYIRVRTGNITVTGSASDGFHTNDYFIADGGTVNITAGSDGVECEQGYIIMNGGSYTIKSANRGIWTSYTGGVDSIKTYLNINGGTINITAAAADGIETQSTLTINSGNINVTSTDNGLKADSALYVNGGNIYAYSTANDGMDSNGIFTVTGGKVVTISTVLTQSGLDCGTRTLQITGGLVLGIGGTTSAPSSSVSTVPSVIMGIGTANKIIHIEAANGTEALTFLAPVGYSTLLFGSSKLLSKTTYNVYTGGSVASGTSFNGLYLSGTYTKSTKTGSFTTTNLVTQTGGTVNTQ